ncbi:nitrous oxidase accessory protein [Anoxybacillus kamchatkensis]|uniref:right-handed parallel beta-helix repeat-containing protein n=1 Tax=Anoxybacillus ayderensis TaxID=265546 RepID=UPI0015EC6794|nr:nitrous oxide reductase family maturation protein NosD [Anoxybacillus ayderensis]MBA2878217.1 nitrous oxidase accessory protein [Anoxybacillus ayderensis]
MRSLFFLLIPIVTLLFAETAYGQTMEVHKQLQQAIDEAHAGDVLVVKRGVYEGPIIIHKPIHLIAEPGAVVDGDGSEYVVTIRAPHVYIEGLTIRRSAYGKGAGVQIKESSHVTLKNVRIEDVHYGVYVEKGKNIHLVKNVMRGRDVHFAQRGNGIHLLKTKHVVIRQNDISRVQDGVYLDGAEHTTIEKNKVTNARYAIHFMYAEDGIAKENVLMENINGIMMMMSKRFTIEQNTIAKQLDYRGYGALIYDSEHVVMHNNTLLYNSTALSLQNGRHCTIKANEFIGNYRALHSLYENDNTIVVENKFLGNMEDALIQGAPIAFDDGEKGNYWDTYRFYDLNDDGIGDASHRIRSMYSRLLRQWPSVQFYFQSPALALLDTTESFFTQAQAQGEDRFPLMEVDYNKNETNERSWRLLLFGSILLVSSLFMFVYGRRMKYEKNC